MALRHYPLGGLTNIYWSDLTRVVTHLLSVGWTLDEPMMYVYVYIYTYISYLNVSMKNVGWILIGYTNKTSLQQTHTFLLWWAMFKVYVSWGL